MNQSPSIYEYIKSEESAFDTEEIQLGENWFWSFKKHVQLIFHLKNGIFFTGENNWLRAFKNIMEPMLELCYWTEDIEVKDVVFFIEEQGGRVLSFLLKKYHDEVYTREHDLDTMFDEITESDIDYGGVLVQKGADAPEVLALNSVAFCDQTDMMGGPVFFKHFFSPSKLRSMSSYGWGEEKNGATISLEDLCTLATFEKDSSGTNEKKNRTPGKTIEVYIGRGDLPETYLEDNDNMEYSCGQLQIVAFYTDKNNKEQGVTLYRKKENEGNLKFFASKKVYQRALGRGVGERLLGPQIWTNFLTIHKTQMLESGAKTPLVTDDPTFTQKNKIQDMENNEVTTIEEGKSIKRIETISVNSVQLYEKSIDEWYQQGQLVSAAFDPLQGIESPSGTTFRGQNQVVQQGKGSHDKKRGQRAKFIEEIYRDWIIPDMVKEINGGQKFMATLSAEEMAWVADQIATNEVNQRIKDLILDGKLVTQEDQDAFMQASKQAFFKKGNKHLLEALKGEFDDIATRIGINIAGKQKNLAAMSDKILSIFQQAFANPQNFMATMQIPGMAKAFEDILEFGGLNISDFSTLIQAQPAPAQLSAPANGQPAPTAPPTAPVAPATA